MKKRSKCKPCQRIRDAISRLNRMFKPSKKRVKK